MSVLTVDGSLEPKGHEQLTSIESPAALSPPSGARLALIQATGENIRWRDDGTDPTSATGIQLEAGNDFWYVGNLASIRLIEESSGAAVNVAYYAG